MKKVLIISIVIFCLFINTEMGRAANFGNSPIGQITFVKKLPNGNILAFSNHSEEMAVFDYKEWEVMDTPSITSLVHYDDTNNDLYFSEYIDWNEDKLKKYDIDNDKWELVAKYFEVDEFGYDNHAEDYFVHDNDFYGIGEEGVYKLEGNNWSKEAGLPYDDELETSTPGGYDADNGVYKAYYHQEHHPHDDGLWEYDVDSKEWGNKKNYDNMMSYTYDVFLEDNDVIFRYRHDIYLNDGKQLDDDWEKEEYDDHIDLRKTDYITASIDTTNYMYFWEGNHFRELGKFDFNPLVACKDKYGNIFVAGDGGNVAVVDDGGKIHTSTDFYTEFIMHGTAQDAAKAKNAAQQAQVDAQAAKNESQQAKNEASAAHTDAEKAKNLARENSDKLDNIKNAINDNDNVPPEVKEIKGKDGATATRNSTFDVAVEASDNKTSSSNLEFRVKADTGNSYSSWVPINDYATATGIDGNGSHSIIVEVKDNTGNVSSGKLTIFKL